MGWVRTFAEIFVGGSVVHGVCGWEWGPGIEDAAHAKREKTMDFLDLYEFFMVF